MIVVFMLHSVASAQEDYYIRTDSRINLRATYSLEGDLVETVPTGTTLHVVGRFNRWLKIERDGQTVWMADWVHYTRVDDGSQEQISIQESPDPGSNQVVDNCCFVDRQCAYRAGMGRGVSGISEPTVRCARRLHRGQWAGVSTHSGVRIIRSPGGKGIGSYGGSSAELVCLRCQRNRLDQGDSKRCVGASRKKDR